MPKIEQLDWSKLRPTTPEPSTRTYGASFKKLAEARQSSRRKNKWITESQAVVLVDKILAQGIKKRIDQED